MRIFVILAIFWVLQVTAVQAQSLPAPASFQTSASIGLSLNSPPPPYTQDGQIKFTSVIATIEPDPHGKISWLRIKFYTYEPADSDIPDIAKGKTASMDNRSFPPDKQEVIRTAHMDLAVGPDNTLRQFNVALGKHKGCAMTGIVPVQKFVTDGTHVVLKVHGAYACDIPSDGTYNMNIDVDAPVYRVQ